MFTKIELKWGLIFAAMQLVWITLEFLFGLHDKYISWHPTVSNFIALSSIIIMVLAIRDKRAALNGKITFGTAFLCGLGVSVVVAILSLLTQLIFFRLINPNFFANFIRYAIENSKTTLEQAQANFNLTSFMLQGAIGAIIIGVFTSLVIATVIRKDLRNI